MGNVETSLPHDCSHCGKTFYEMGGKFFQQEESHVYTLAPNCPHCGGVFMPTFANTPRLNALFKAIKQIGLSAGAHASEITSLSLDGNKIVRLKQDKYRLDSYITTVWVLGIGVLALGLFSHLFKTYIAAYSGLYFVLSDFDYYLFDFSMQYVLLFELLCCLILAMLQESGRRLQGEIEEVEKSFYPKVVAIIVACTSTYVSNMGFSEMVNEFRDCFESGSVLFNTFAPLVAIFLPNFSQYFVLQRTFAFAAGSWAGFTRFIQGFQILDWNAEEGTWLYKIATTIKRYAWIGGVAAFGFAMARIGFLSKKQKRMAVPKKKRQETHNDPRCNPVDPESVPLLPTVIIPSNPPFNGHNVVHRSLVQIGGNYTATAFRTGQHLITAIHCLTKHNGNFGAFIYNPEEKNYLWAPMERCFRTPGIRIAGDGIAVLSLPNSNYTLSRASASIGVPPGTELNVGCYLSNNDRVNPNWSFSSGKGVWNPATNNISLWASIEAGSSGGPVLHPNGYVVGVAYAENQFYNVAIGITDEVIAFLANSGAAPSAPEDLTPPVEESSQDSSQTIKSKTSSTPKEVQSKNGTPGPQPQPKKKSESSASTSGDIPTGKDKNKKKERIEGKAGTVPPEMGQDDFESNPAYTQDAVYQALKEKEKGISKNLAKFSEPMTLSEKAEYDALRTEMGTTQRSIARYITMMAREQF